MIMLTTPAALFLLVVLGMALEYLLPPPPKVHGLVFVAVRACWVTVLVVLVVHFVTTKGLL